MRVFVASWRTALRVARREARRARGRSLLVIAMIGVPVLFLTFAAVSYDMFTLTGAEKADRTMGTADARIQWDGRVPMVQMPDPYTDGAWEDADATYGKDRPPSTDVGTLDELATTLGSGTRAIPLRRGTVEMRTADGIGELNATSVDANDPLTRGFVEVREGRAPRSSSEVALTPQAAARLGVGIGGTVRSADERHSSTVVGLVEFPSRLEEVVLFAPTGDKQPTEFSVKERSWLVDTPSLLDWHRVRQLNQLGLVVASRAVFLNPPPSAELPDASDQVDADQLTFGSLIAGLALLEIVLLAGPAFAVSARRRQRQLALVAANGGTPAQVRRIVLADGVVLGAVGALVGVAAGILIAFAARPYVEESLAHVRAGGYRVFPVALAVIAGLAVVTGVLAALVPAFITARQNVVSSLAGRRGITRSKKRWLVIGAGLVAVGAAIVVSSALHREPIDASMNLSRPRGETIMLAGLVLGELGLVLCTPALVGLIARLGRILPLAPRIALRDAARNRASAAPAISAVMAAVAGSVALGLYFQSSAMQQREEYRLHVPLGFIEAMGGPESDWAAAETALRASTPVVDVRRVSSPSCADPAKPQPCLLSLVQLPEFACPYETIQETEHRPLTADEQRAARADSRCDDAEGAMFLRHDVTVDDGTALAVLTGASGDDLAAAIAMLRAGGVVVRDPTVIKNGRSTFSLIDGVAADGSPAEARRVEFPAYLLRTGIPGGPIVSSAALAQAHLSAQPTRLVASTTRVPTQAERDRLAKNLDALGVDIIVEDGPTVEFDTRLLLLLAAAAAVTLGAAAIGTGLAAADGRADLSTLAAVGASPRLRRRLSLSQSGVIAGLGSLLGALAGAGTAVAIIVALNQRYADTWPAPPDLPIAVPWPYFALSLLVVPGIAMLGAGMLTRSRLSIERR
jgi:putative ABC transport system permease protein